MRKINFLIKSVIASTLLIGCHNTGQSTGSVKSQKRVVVKDDGLISMEPGRGINSSLGTPATEICFIPFSTKNGPSTTSVEFSAQTFNDMFKSSFENNEQYTYSNLFGSGNIITKFELEGHSDSHTVMYLLHAQYSRWVGISYATSDISSFLNANGLGHYRDGWVEFTKSCGDAVPSEYEEVAEGVVKFKFVFKDVGMKIKFENAFENTALPTPGVPNVSVSSIEAKVKSFTQMQNTQVSVYVTAKQLGGDSASVVNVLPSYGIAGCTATSTYSCDGLFSNVQNYLSYYGNIDSNSRGQDGTGTLDLKLAATGRSKYKYLYEYKSLLEKADSRNVELESLYNTYINKAVDVVRYLDRAKNMLANYPEADEFENTQLVIDANTKIIDKLNLVKNLIATKQYNLISGGIDIDEGKKSHYLQEMLETINNDIPYKEMVELDSKLKPSVYIGDYQNNNFRIYSSLINPDKYFITNEDFSSSRKYFLRNDMHAANTDYRIIDGEFTSSICHKGYFKIYKTGSDTEVGKRGDFSTYTEICPGSSDSSTKPLKKFTQEASKFHILNNDINHLPQGSWKDSCDVTSAYYDDIGKKLYAVCQGGNQDVFHPQASIATVSIGGTCGNDNGVLVCSN